ncbi:MAG: hypothetical protein IPK26_05815 [Planctomycetes bacterium]|nr:hypothetical protein [Planctomycetota bacterium]
MSGRLRWLVAAAFVLLFFLIPSPLAQRSGRTCMTALQIREWLLGGTDPGSSPLATWRQGGTAPPLHVDLRRSPPITDAAELARWQGDYARLAIEWAAAATTNGLPTRIDGARGALPLLIRIGEHGAQAELPNPDGSKAVRTVPFFGRESLLPAFVAIVLAVLTQRVLLALAAGCLAGGIAWAFTLHPQAGSRSTLQKLADGAFQFVGDALWRRSLCEDFYVRITLFVVFLFMAIGLMTRCGGIQGLVDRIARFASGPVRSQLCAFATGLSMFFDDYSSCIVTGTTMQPLTDRAGVSREKLAWIVDSTAAPIASLSVFSTWIAYEMSQYRVPLTQVTRPDGRPYAATEAFAVFLQTMPYRFYCVFALFMVFLCIVLRRDFGPMLAAERRARHLGKPLADDARPMAGTGLGDAAPAAGTPTRARNALLPLLVLVLGTIGIMLWQGSRQWQARTDEDSGFVGGLRFLLANAQSDWALLLASVSAWLLVIALIVGQRLLPSRAIVATSLRATRALGLAFGILFLAWSLGHLCRDLGTSIWLTAAFRDWMSAAALPLVLFFSACLIAFATGTSYGTMAILLPNVVVLAHQIGTEAQFTGSAAAGGPALMLLSIGAVLEGAIFGDHCSPISDTTVLSSLGSRCDHLAHVQTQMPYAVLTMLVAATCGYLPMVLIGPQWWPLAWAGGALVLAGFLLWRGRDPAAPFRPSA